MDVDDKDARACSVCPHAGCTWSGQQPRRQFTCTLTHSHTRATASLDPSDGSSAPHSPKQRQSGAFGLSLDDDTDDKHSRCLRLKIQTAHKLEPPSQTAKIPRRHRYSCGQRHVLKRWQQATTSVVHAQLRVWPGLCCDLHPYLPTHPHKYGRPDPTASAPYYAGIAAFATDTCATPR